MVSSSCSNFLKTLTYLFFSNVLQGMRKARFFYEKDADVGILGDKVIGVIGYGNQGRAQAIAMRKLFNLNVIVGNIRDESWKRAEEDGFKVYEIGEAAGKSDVILLLVPDEVAPQVYSESILPAVKDKKHVVLGFASGYNIAYGFIEPAPNMDVVMMAPRMIGWGILHRVIEEGKGYPTLVAVAQDVSGRAWDYALAIAKAAGAMLPGGFAVESSFEEEAVTDLFSEHTWVGAMLFMFRTAFEVLVEAGIPPEVALLELYASGELVEIARAITEIGLFEQMKLHSRTSQYGQLTRGPRYAGEELKREFKRIVEALKDGSFAREWALEQKAGLPVFKRMWKLVKEHPIYEYERKLYKMLGRIKE